MIREGLTRVCDANEVGRIFIGKWAFELFVRVKKSDIQRAQ